MTSKLTFSIGGLGVTLALAACTRTTEPPAQPSESQHAQDTHQDEHDGQQDHADHQHPTAGPHGGHLIELGNQQYHAELSHDDATHAVTLYLLDSAGEKPVAADQPQITLQVFEDGKFVDYVLKATDDKPQGASEFRSDDEQLAQVLSQDQSLRGRVRVTIGGQEFTGVLEHAAH